MKRLAVLALLFALVVSTPVYAELVRFGRLTVYTRNLYIGTDFDPVLAALQGSGSAVDAARTAFNEIAQTKFPQRATALATEIEAIRPHLIGLQEVFDFRLNGQHGDLPFIDYLQTLLAALEARHLHYRVAAVVNTINLTFSLDFLPLAGDEVLQVLDRNVILVRSDVDTTVADFHCLHPSADGCNYTVLLPLPPPLPNAVVRGFVGVDAVVDGAIYRFVTTHLEVGAIGAQELTAIQKAQAAELVVTIGLATPPKRPVILAGDFNSAPTDAAGSVYDIIRAAFYADTWQRNVFKSLRADGFTCCQNSDLNNDESLLDGRIDLIFVKNNLGVLPFSFTGLVLSVVIGDEPISDSQPKWSSDHAGPFAVLHGIPLFEGHDSLHLAGTE